MKKILTSFSRSRSLPSSLVKRSKLILLAAPGITNQTISHEISLHYNNVATWRNRFLLAIPTLADVEANKPEELEVQGIHVVSTDEMTGIQALEHKYPDKLPLPSSTAKREFEYIRHGTASLIGFFDIAGGFLYAPYLNKTRTEEDFCHAVEEVVNTDPNGTWILVCDGLNTHKSEALVRFIPQACSREDELEKKGKTGILKSMASREAFPHDPAHRIRLVYTPKHSSWLNQIELWFGIISHKLLKRKSCLSIEELEESIRKFIRQYNLTAHPFKWTYAGIPLTV